jgi:malate dehydrogenase (oxaloacetate-decarboxylating)
MVSAAVGAVAGGRQGGLAQAELNSPIQQIHQAMWRPAYPQIEPI